MVDDLSPQFVKRAGGWKQANSGYLRHNYWVPARAGKAKRIATWRPTLTAPGDYRIVVRIPSRDATTRKAVYRIKTVDGWVKHRLDQSTAQGKWVDVGTFRLTTTPAVKLTDRTGERASLGRRVGFDAIRFVPVGQPRVSSDPASPADQPPADQPRTRLGPRRPPRSLPLTRRPSRRRTPSRPSRRPSRRPRSPTAGADAASPTPDRTKEPTPSRRPSRRRSRHPSRRPSRPRSRRPSATKEPTPEPTVTTGQGTRAHALTQRPEPTPEPSPEPIAQPAAEPSAEPDASPAAG